MKRFAFLDWTRGLAVVIMIQCHVFNSFTRLDLRQGGPYVLSQFVGGMAAVLFLFMAGMTLAFQMDGLDRREARASRRWNGALRRAAYVLGIAYAFRTSNWLVGYPHSSTSEILKVDILNCMGAAMLALSLLATTAPRLRARWAIGLGLAVAGAAPIVDGLAWSSAPPLLRNYIVPSSGRFPFFPWAAYLAFGLAAGAVLKRTPPERLERAMQWSVLAGFGLIFSAQYFSNIPFSLYPSSSFWINSPALVFIRTGISLVLLAAAYVWTEFGAGNGWSWMQALGKTSLLVYWLHILIVYGDIAKPLKKSFAIPQAALAALAVTGLMVAIAAARLWWKDRRAARLQLAAAA